MLQRKGLFGGCHIPMLQMSLSLFVRSLRTVLMLTDAPDVSSVPAFISPSALNCCFLFPEPYPVWRAPGVYLLQAWVCAPRPHCRICSSVTWRFLQLRSAAFQIAQLEMLLHWCL